MTGADEATAAYVEGDLEMAQTYQSNAAVLAAGPSTAPPRTGGVQAG